MGANTIYVNTMQRTMQSMLRSATPMSGGMSFQSFLRGAAEDNLSAYKASIEDRITSMHIDSSRVRDDMFIDISDEGYRAMQQDPSYEAWVLDTIQTTLASPDPFASVAGGSAIHFQFGATKAEFHGDAGRKGSGDLGDLLGTKKKGYWEERAERREADRELNDKIADARARARAANEMKRIRGEATTGTDDAAAASEIIQLLLASYMQTMS